MKLAVICFTKKGALIGRRLYTYFKAQGVNCEACVPERFLEQDWKDFLSFVERGDTGDIPLGVLVLSPWGMFVEQEASSPRGSGGNPVFLIGAAAAVLLLIAIFVFLRI